MGFSTQESRIPRRNISFSNKSPALGCNVHCESTAIAGTKALPCPASRSITRLIGQLWTKIFSFPTLLATALFGSIFVFDSGSVADPDIWWHLRNAEVLVQTHAVVTQDFYSFTAAGSRWINEAWLGELPYYFGWQWLGIRGIYLVMLFETELILLGVFGLAQLSCRNVKASFVASWLAVWLATVSFGPRTLLAGWICLVAELCILELFRQGKDWSWCLVPLFVVWANLHGSWLIGIVLFCVFCGCGLVTGEWGRVVATRWTVPQTKKLAMVGSLSIAGLFLNPYGYHLVCYPFNFAFQQKLNVSHVDEWMSLDFHTLRGKILFAMLAAAIVLALVRKRCWRLDEVAFLLIGFYAAMTYSRFLFLAGIVLAPILAKELEFLPPYRPAIDRPWLNAALIIAIVGGCVWRFPSRDFLLRDTVRNYPVKALAYLQQLHPQGRVFNDCLWGGYLTWNVRDIPVFIDSRIDIYEYNGVFADYLDALGIRNTLGILNKYDIRYVLFAKDSPVAYLLTNTPAWKTDYADETTVLLERVGGRKPSATRGP
jgi:hypothetical protein